MFYYSIASYVLMKNKIKLTETELWLKIELSLFNQNSSAHIADLPLNTAAKKALHFLRNGKCIVALYKERSNFSHLYPP